MARLKVLISGAGIAGNALAFWLSKLGHEVSVIERFPSLRTTGLQLDLRGHAIPVLRRMGLDRAFRAKRAPEQGMQVVGSSGRRWAFFPANKSGEGLQGFTTDWEIMRGDLCRLLYDASKDNANFIFGSGIDSFEQKDGNVQVRFTDGHTDTFDLVVGADGVWSHTRKLMLGPDEPDPFQPVENLYLAYFTMPRPLRKGEEYIATTYVAPGGKGIMTRRTNSDEIQVYLSCKTDSERLRKARRGDVEEEKAGMAEVLKGSGWITEDVLKALPTVKDFYCERLGLVKMQAWYKGNVVLVGDAAYCPAALTGMGTSSAFVGSYILAGEIAKHCGGPNEEQGKEGLATALRAYDHKFRPFMDQVQKGVGENTDQWPSTSFGVTVMNLLLGVASLFRINVLGKFVLKEDVKGWDLPDYRELHGEVKL
ncbi:hypothetical protein jhhlp_007892 [Lomentospora prolificans]|uniref:FAD-binding domain-containing protein n=1 Tax=Lomentospora prolificans TaxID=41688 RepID=A0A2N3N0V7_9PEZI|nr:hypothetical protein jhhlp_007892 [Lomentospora prolificans]